MGFDDGTHRHALNCKENQQKVKTRRKVGKNFGRKPTISFMGGTGGQLNECEHMALCGSSSTANSRRKPTLELAET